MHDADDLAELNPPPPLERHLGVWQATALNVANMVGIGPFITIPAFIAAMHGPQALVAWVIAAVLVICDGLVWSELGAALPGSGGSYHFLREVFGGYRWGRLIPFLFIWQFLVSGALEMASGYIGALGYLAYIFPSLGPATPGDPIPMHTRWIAVAAVAVVTLLLCQRIRHIGWLGIVLCTGTIITVLTVIAAGLANFNPSLIKFPPDAFRLDAAFASGLGGAMLIAIYDYLGYFNVCHLGDEVREPHKTIPRAVIGSLVLIAVVYLTMNIAIIGVVPWQVAMDSKNVAADFMARLYGPRVASFFSWFIIWTAMASTFALLLGYSRIPYAAALRGDFFRAFSYVHPTRHFPAASLATLGLLTAAFCFLDLGTVISAAVCVRILVQFIGQIVALHLVHTTRPDIRLPFRMWLYPLPSIIALAGWLYVLGTSGLEVIWISLIVINTGMIAFELRLFWSEWKQSLESSP